MNFDCGFDHTYYQTFCFDQSDNPAPFRGAFIGDKKICVCDNEDPFVMDIYKCLQNNFQEYIYLESYDRSQTCTNKIIILRKELEGCIDKLFIKGTQMNDILPLMPNCKSSSSDMFKELKKCYREFGKKLLARKLYECQVNDAMRIFCSYKGCHAAYKHSKSNGIASAEIIELLQQSKLTGKQIYTMSKYSKGIVSIDEFFHEHLAKYSEKGIVLGLNHKAVVGIFSSMIGFEDYGDTYQRYYQNYLENENFMPDLIKEGKDVIFLVPSNILTHPKKGATARELEWLLKNPENMKKILYVFGAYAKVPDLELDDKSKGLVPDSSCYLDLFTESLVKRIFWQSIHGKIEKPKKPENYQEKFALLSFHAVLEKNNERKEVKTSAPIIIYPDIDIDSDSEQQSDSIIDEGFEQQGDSSIFEDSSSLSVVIEDISNDSITEITSGLSHVTIDNDRYIEEID